MNISNKCVMFLIQTMQRQGAHSDLPFGDDATVEIAHILGIQPYAVSATVFNEPIIRKTSDLNANQIIGGLDNGKMYYIPGSKGEFIPGNSLKVYYSVNPARPQNANNNFGDLLTRFAAGDLHARIFVNGDVNGVGFDNNEETRHAVEHAKNVVSALSNDLSMEELNSLMGDLGEPLAVSCMLPCTFKRTNIGEARMVNQLKPYFVKEPYFQSFASHADNAPVRAGATRESQCIEWRLPDAKGLTVNTRQARLCDLMSSDFLNTSQMIPNHNGTRIELINASTVPVAISSVQPRAANNFTADHTPGSGHADELTFTLPVVDDATLYIEYKVYTVKNDKYMKIIDAVLAKGQRFPCRQYVAESQPFVANQRNVGFSITPGVGNVLCGMFMCVATDGAVPEVDAAIVAPDDRYYMRHGTYQLPPTGGLRMSTGFIDTYDLTVNNQAHVCTLAAADDRNEYDQKTKRIEMKELAFPNGLMGRADFLRSNVFVVPFGVGAKQRDVLDRHKYLPTSVARLNATFERCNHVCTISHLHLFINKQIHTFFIF